TPLTQQHLKKVYARFALCMLVEGAGAYVHVVTHFIQRKRLGLLAGCAFLTEVGLGSALGLCIAINPIGP
ncbi:hypothetical protein FD754_007766, partial [Muntiacus muntjak]